MNTEQEPTASVELSDLAHEIWAAAQLTPNEGIEVGVARIQALLSRYGRPAGDVQSAAAQGANAAVAAIQFALEADDGMTWLRCWNEGDFEACRNEWPGTPEECFIGADPLHPSTRAALAVNKVDDARDAVQEFIDATDALLESQERKTWTSGYVKEMTAGERMAVAARWRKARTALTARYDGMRWPSDFPMKHEGDSK